MLALLYLGVAICVGDRLCGRFYRFVSAAHRWATATLVGLLLGTCFTYQAARHLASASNPMVWGNILFFALAAIFLLKCPAKRNPPIIGARSPRAAKWDWVVLGLYGALASWMMFATLDFKGSQLLIGVNQWSDYGPNTAIVQNFAFGHNFPAEYPHFASEPIRYHFLFYFLSGNLEFLGLSLVWSLNILSILTMVCMLALVMALGELLFKSRAVGCIASAFFFFHGTLNLVPFLRAQTSFKGALLAIYRLGNYLTSGYPYRGEDWGIWTQVVFINQRHLASSIGVFLVVLIFLFDRYLERARQKELDRALAVRDDEPAPLLPIDAPAIAPEIPAEREQIEHASESVSAAEGERPYDLRSAEQSFSEPETVTENETKSSDTLASEERLSESASSAAVDEPQTFHSRAYDEYMRSESAAAPESETQEAEAQEAEALEFIKQSSQESAPSSATQAQSSPASPEAASEAQFPPVSPELPGEAQLPPVAVSEPALTKSRGMISQLVHDNLVSGQGFIFSGLLLGALPYWNAPVFTAAAAVLAFFFVLFPYRRYMVGLGLTAALVGIPQVLALRSGNVRAGPALVHWGYTLGNVPVSQVAKYLGFTFGLKWVLILVGLLFLSWRNLRIFISICSLFLLTFCFQFSDEALANHKFMNIWLVLANLFVAYGLWRLWHLRIKGWAIPARLVAILLVAPIIVGGIIDFFPIHNIGFVYTNYVNDRLIGFIRAETKPDAVFLTDKFVNHPILLAGRRIFFGYTYFTWGAGYNLPKREADYTRMYESKNAHQVFTLLKAHKIDYVAFDGGIRSFFKNSNEEQVYAPNFKKVFEGAEYWQLTLYKVPENADFVPTNPGFVPGSSPVPAVSLFESGPGTGNGQFTNPRGLVADNAGNILVCDSGNGRIQKFSPTGAFLNIIGKMGSGPGEFREPNGIAVDSTGNMYVADVANHRIQKLKSDGTFLAEWKGPEPGFYGPRDLSVGPDNSVYVVDQGHARIVKFDSNGKVLAVWGGPGQNDGQFIEPTSVAVDGKNNRVYVSDPRSMRIEVFDTNGKFLSKWLVNEWGGPAGWYFQDLVVDSTAGVLYASSNSTDDVFVFDLNGNRVKSLKPIYPDKVAGAGAMALQQRSLYIINTFPARVTRIESVGK